MLNLFVFWFWPVVGKLQLNTLIPLWKRKVEHVKERPPIGVRTHQSAYGIKMLVQSGMAYIVSQKLVMLHFSSHSYGDLRGRH